MFSHSRINCFKECPKKYQYKYIDKLYPLDDQSAALSMGKSLHYGIEHGSSDKAIEEMDKNTYYISEQGETDKVIVMAMIDAYLKKFPNHSKLEHEVHLIGGLIEQDDFQMYLDGLEETDEGFWIIETKSTSTLDDNYINKLDYNDQISRYYYFANMIVDKPLLGIKYRIIKKPRIRQKKDESVVQFRQRLVELLSQDDNIVELIITRTEDQIESCIKDTIYDMNVIKQTTRFTKNLNSCTMYNKPCPYMNLCRNIEDAELLFIRKDDENGTSSQ